jgi:uncharacterized protein YggE
MLLFQAIEVRCRGRHVAGTHLAGILLTGILLAGSTFVPGRVVAQTAGSDQRSDGIAVQGIGERVAKPNQVELDIQVSGAAELYGDALVKFRDVKRRTLEAFEALKIDNLSIEERGVALSRGDSAEAMQMAMRGQDATSIKFKVDLSSRLRIKLTDISEMPPEVVLETLGKMLDTARDSGADVGPSAAEVNMAYRYGRPVTGSISRFVLQDFESVREEAYKAAIADARQRAERLAKLNGLKLGRVLSVSEVAVSGDETTSQPQPNYNVQAGSGEPHRGLRIETDMFADIPVRVRLMVRFAIDDPVTETAQAR